jgi:hypothetical protein
MFLGLEKFGITFSLETMYRIAKFDDAIGSVFGLTSRYGGSIVIAGEK